MFDLLESGVKFVPASEKRVNQVMDTHKCIWSKYSRHLLGEGTCFCNEILAGGLCVACVSMLSLSYTLLS